MKKVQKKNPQGPSTTAIHSSERRVEGAVSFPIFQTSMFVFGNETDYDDIKYIRHNNMPNQNLVGEKIAVLEKAEAGLVFSSGMAAISTTLFSLLKAGDHLLAHKSLYGGCMDLLEKDLKEFGIETTFFDACSPGDWEKLVKKNTKLIYVEAITNPLTYVPDFPAILDLAKKKNLFSVIDSTFATPLNFNPIPLGFDVAIHSCSKYLAGHSDLVAGALVGSRDMVQKIKKRSNHLGGCLDPFACHILHRSLKTFPLRMTQHNKNSLLLAETLQKMPNVENVFYPGLESHPQYKTAKNHFSGFGGIIALEMRSSQLAKGVVENSQLFIHAGSLGGVESLICRPSATSHLALPTERQQQAGIGSNLIRLSVGIEDFDDLLDDLNQAIEKSS